MSEFATPLFVFIDIVFLIAVPVLVLRNSWRTRRRTMLKTILALLLWAGASVILAIVWFYIAWSGAMNGEWPTIAVIVANTAYMVVGVGIVRIRRRAL